MSPATISDTQHKVLYNMDMYGPLCNDHWGRSSVRATTATIKSLCRAGYLITETDNTDRPRLVLSATGRDVLRRANEVLSDRRASQATDDLYLTRDEDAAFIVVRDGQWTQYEWLGLGVDVRIGLIGSGFAEEADTGNGAWQVTALGKRARLRYRTGLDPADDEDGRVGAAGILELRRGIDQYFGTIFPGSDPETVRELVDLGLVAPSDNPRHQPITCAGYVAAGRAFDVRKRVEQAAEEYYRLRADGGDGQAAEEFFARSTPPGVDPVRFRSTVAQAVEVLSARDDRERLHAAVMNRLDQHYGEVLDQITAADDVD